MLLEGDTEKYLRLQSLDGVLKCDGSLRYLEYQIRDYN